MREIEQDNAPGFGRFLIDALRQRSLSPNPPTREGQPATPKPKRKGLLGNYEENLDNPEVQKMMQNK
jgi:hypothetical protein